LERGNRFERGLRPLSLAYSPLDNVVFKRGIKGVSVYDEKTNII